MWYDYILLSQMLVVSFKMLMTVNPYGNLWSERSIIMQKKPQSLPPRSQMALKGERSKAVTTSLPQMFQIEFINCMNFTISSSDLHRQAHTSVTASFSYVSLHPGTIFSIVFRILSHKGRHPHTQKHSYPGESSSLWQHRSACVRAVQGLTEEKSLWCLLLLWGISPSSSSTAVRATYIQSQASFHSILFVFFI